MPFRLPTNISIMSISKVFEKLLYNHLISFIEKNEIIPKVQHGFRKGKSVTTQLLETFNEFSIALENKQFIDVIYFDFSKAFDTVPHDKLVNKLYKIGIRGSLLQLLKNYLADRKFTVMIQDYKSDLVDINRGVPQGSILGPLFFLIYISDLPSFCETKDVKIKLFADDLKAYTFSKNTKDFEINLQEFIIKLEKYAEENSLKLSAEKTFLLHIGPKNPLHTYTLNNQNIKTVIL